MPLACYTILIRKIPKHKTEYFSLYWGRHLWKEIPRMYEYFDFDYKNSVFEWDEEKAASNFIKHGIRFETTPKVFVDENKLIQYDDKSHGQTDMMS